MTPARGDRDARLKRGMELRRAGRHAEAEGEFRALLATDPGDAEAAFALAWLLREQGRAKEAGKALVRLAHVSGADPDSEVTRLLQITGFLRDTNRFEEAIETLRLAIRLRPSDAGLAFRLARLCQATGRFDDALAELRKALDLDPGLGGAWLSLAQLQHFSDPDDPDLQRLRSAAQQPANAEAGMCLGFALGKAYDDLGERALAWEQYARGNQMRRTMQPWDREAWRRRLQALLSRPVQASGPPAHPDRHPVYIVGMLRSGTTLLESLLDRHPRVTGRGELNFLAHLAAADGVDPRAAGAQLWTHLRLDGPNDAWYVDKNPLNFRFLGFLAAALPEARIVHVTRDARDACLSCWFQLFAHPDAAFADDLDDLLDYYRGYRRLMRRWQAELGDRIVTVAYEDLVNDTRATMARVLEHVGLDSQESNRLFPDESGQDRDSGKQQPEAGPGRPIRTASAWQARQPVHAGSIGRWRGYHEFAPRFFDALEEINREIDREKP